MKRSNAARSVRAALRWSFDNFVIKTARFRGLVRYIPFEAGTAASMIRRPSGPANPEPYVERNDEDLMLAAGRGDRAAFGVLVDRHYAAIMRFVQRFLGHVGRDMAEDLAQDVFMTVWRRAATFESRGTVVAWLFWTATRACIDYRRRQRFRRAMSLWSAPAQDLRDKNCGPSVGSEDDEQKLIVRQAITQLPFRQRAALILRHYHELSYADIAAVLELSTSSVESLLFRARRGLEGKLRRVSSEELPQDSRVSSAN